MGISFSGRGDAQYYPKMPPMSSTQKRDAHPLIKSISQKSHQVKFKIAPGCASKFWVSASLARRRLKTTAQTGTNSINRVGINRFPTDVDLLNRRIPFGG
jgi:hypothetical protein